MVSSSSSFFGHVHVLRALALASSLPAAGLVQHLAWSLPLRFVLFGFGAILCQAVVSIFGPNKTLQSWPLLWLSPLQRPEIQVFLHSNKHSAAVSAMVSNSERAFVCAQARAQVQPQVRASVQATRVGGSGIPGLGRAVPHQNCMHVMPMLRHIRACPSAQVKSKQFRPATPPLRKQAAPSCFGQGKLGS